MNWKVFTTAFGSAALLALPQNSFTCGPSEDPYDYYTSFFSNRLGTGKEYQPFYYTGLSSFYDEWNQDTVAYETDKVLQEWMAYGKTVRWKDAGQLVYESSAEEVSLLAKSLGGAPLPSALKANSLAQNLIKEKKEEAIRYLQFAKKTAAISPVSAWEDAPKKDTAQLDNYLAEAESRFSKTTDPFLKNKYAFQRCKIAFYAENYGDCIRFYDTWFNESNPSAVNDLALSYKGGSLYHSGSKKEAAYIFSKSFTQSAQNKKQAYLGFWWATNRADASLIPAYTALCKNNNEKAAMLGMFAMHGSSYKLAEMGQVYALNPASPLLPLLATREINKLEESYLTPTLGKEKGGKALYITWAWREEEAEGKPPALTQLNKTITFFTTLMADNAALNRSVYAAGAAYLHLMKKDYAGAKTVLAKTAGLQPDAKVKDQTQLINLLIAANEAQSITKEQEAALLPSMKWLVQKAKTDADYRPFCRNFFSEILAQKYEQQADAARAALAYGMADLPYVSDGENDYYVYTPAINFVQEEMATEALLKLYGVMASPFTETEKFFVQNGSVKRNAVIDVIGTAHLRDRAYAKAIEWLSKIAKPEPLVETQYNYQTGKETTVKIDPLHDYLNDWQRYSKTAPVAYTKLTLARKLQELQGKINAKPTGDEASKLFYQYASALYNMSHYGNSWAAVAYGRSGTDWNTGNYKLPWQKEYFGVYEARTWYQKAYDAALNKEFKAACLFMVIKCAQRQVVMPEYDYKNEGAAEKAAAAFDRLFMANPLFGKFKTEFGTTKFYQYAYNRCSYLRDFVGKRASPVKPKR